MTSRTPAPAIHRNGTLELQRDIELSEGKPAFTSTANETRLLILYVGGTLGMLSSSKGYVPAPGFLFDHLRTQSRFNDPAEVAIASHSYSVESYQHWQTASGENSPLRSASPAVGSHHPANLPLQNYPTLPVITSDGIQNIPCLVSPRNHAHQRIRYAIYEYKELIDSSEVEIQDWINIASDIERNYRAYDAFIILHGTDTLSYSASALSFLLEGLGKTVILTGAQIPLSELRNDAVDNLLGALSIARSYLIPEVTLFFNNKLFRGNRTHKKSSYAFDAFDSPNLAPLATVGIDIDVRWDLVLHPTSLKAFQVHRSMNANVARLSLYPSINASVIRASLAGPIEGCVMESFGSGNVTQRAEVIEALKEAVARGVVIVNITQCAQGTVIDKYAAGSHLKALGIVSGLDMTVECALAKLSYLLARKDLDREAVKAYMSRQIRGELTPLSTVQHKSVAVDEQFQAIFSHLLDWKSSSGKTATSSEYVNAASLTNTEMEALSTTMLPLLITRAASTSNGSLASLLKSTTPSLELLNGAASNFCHPPLIAAASRGCLNNVELLLQYGCSVHISDPISGTSALFCAAINGHLDITRLLRKAGAHFKQEEIESGRVNFESEKARKTQSSGIWMVASNES